MSGLRDAAGLGLVRVDVTVIELTGPYVSRISGDVRSGEVAFASLVRPSLARVAAEAKERAQL